MTPKSQESLIATFGKILLAIALMAAAIVISDATAPPLGPDRTSAISSPLK
jgi:hypothetical protein